MTPPLHPALEPLAFLLGTWVGEGQGEYPTIEPFTYRETVTFGHVGKPFLTYTQRTHGLDGAPMHTETGYLRAPAPHAVEIVASLPTGQSELGTGSCVVTASGLLLDTDAAVRNTPSAKQVDRMVRRFAVEGDTLRYDLWMEAVGQVLTLHLHAELRRA